jgi:hypothetical protein
VALLPAVPVRDWSPEQRFAVEKKVIEMVNGVGDTTAHHWQQGSLALHYRRPMTAKEALSLPAPVRTSPEYNAQVQALRIALVASGVIVPSEIRDLDGA